MTDWNTWSRIVEAAQDPQYRDAVQQFLAQAELSAELPVALDEKLLAPRRAAGATGEQCAFVLCNLGFAALVAGTRAAADFAAGCGRQAKRLAPDSEDLALRCHFLFSKSALMAAALAGLPHVLWGDAADACADYLTAIDEHLELLPAEAVESNAMAAYSFAAQLLSRVERHRAIAHFTAAASRLVDVAFDLAGRLPAAFESRLWASVIPGTAADQYFRRVGALAHGALRHADDSVDHAGTGIAYADEIIARPQPGADPGPIMRTRAELLLSSGRHDQAMEQLETLERLPDGTGKALAGLVRAGNLLTRGAPESAADMLARVAPTAGQALEHWNEVWLGDAGDGNWTSRSADFPLTEVDQEIWRLQAAAAAALDDMPAFLAAAGLSTGFLADAMFEDPSGWTGQSATRAAVAPVESTPLLDEVFDGLAEGTAMLLIVITGAGILTWVARKQDGEIRQETAPGRPDPNSLLAAHGDWCRAFFDFRQRDGDAAISRDECAGAFSRLMDEVDRLWGTLLGTLVDDGITQLVLVGDDLVNIPLHAAGVESGGDRLIDRVPVAFVPSLSALRHCNARAAVEADRRRGLELHCLAAAHSSSVAHLADVLGADPVLVTGISDWPERDETAAASVLHLDARLTHIAGMPLQSVLGAGSLDLSIARLAGEPELTRCELVSGLATESVLPSMLRAPGFDLATVFLASGARSVLASTWQPDDDLAAEMTKTFFRQWVSGLAPAMAFQQSLRALRTGHLPLADFEWACMRLVGAP